MGADDPTKCVILKNWIDSKDLQNFAPLDPNEKGALRLGFLGWVETGKGIFDLLEAIATLRRAGVDVCLEVGGGGSDAERAAQYAQDLGIADLVRFLGWISGAEKKAFFLRSQVIVLPTYAEGSPNSILEALGHARPVISTPVGAIPDILGNSDAGILHEPGDITALAAAIEVFHRDREKMAAAGLGGRKLVEENHSLERASRALQEYLKAPVKQALPSSDGDVR